MLEAAQAGAVTRAALARALLALPAHDGLLGRWAATPARGITPRRLAVLTVAGGAFRSERVVTVAEPLPSSGEVEVDSKQACGDADARGVPMRGRAGGAAMRETAVAVPTPPGGRQVDKRELIERCREHDVKFVRLQFTELYGQLKNISIPATELEKALDNELMFDGSSIRGFKRIEKSDMYFHPDPSTFQVLPWGRA